MNDTVFYVLGISLVCFALIVSAVGLLSKERFPSTAVLRLTVLLFVALVAATTTFSVLNAEDEQDKRRAELAAETETVAENPPPPQPAENGGGKAKPEPKPKAPGGTLALTADKTAIAYDKTELASKPGEVTINFDNPSEVSHDVAIEEGGTEIAKSDLVSQGKTSVTADLTPGKYTYFCTVPGHRESGMEGTLTVK